MSLFTFIFFNLLSLVMLIVLNWYLPYRLGAMFGLRSKASLYIIFIVGMLSLLNSMSLVTRSSSSFINIYYTISTTWLGIFVFLSCFMIVFEIVNLFIKLPLRSTGTKIIFLTLLVSVFAMLNAHSYKVSYLDISIEGLEADLKIMHISDVHLGAYRGKKYLERIVTDTNSLSPDLVFITGDIVDAKVALDKNMLTPLSDINAPIYFVGGNHDAYTGLIGLNKDLRENNVKILENETVITKDIQIIGLNYMNPDKETYDPHQVNALTIKEILPTIEFSKELPKVLLHHGPGGVPYMNEYGVDLVLCGHTHGGQVFPATYIANFTFPYNKGLHNYKGTQIYISQGAGTYMPRMRLGTENEITLITLKPLK